MKILVISDTHGNIWRLFDICESAMPIDMVLHLGDGHQEADAIGRVLDIPVIGVSGNCDTGSAAPRELIMEIAGKRILMTHGDAYCVKSGLDRLLARGVEAGADAILFGHTHLEFCAVMSGILLLNPGNLADHCSRRSYAILTINHEGISAKHYDSGVCPPS